MAVAPHAGARIETALLAGLLMDLALLPTRERELKLGLLAECPHRVTSLPTRERELKHRCPCIGYHIPRRSPRGSAN